MISAIVLTKNEEKNIKNCLQSLKWCDEIIVIDDYSEDKTIKQCQMLSRQRRDKCQNQNSKLKIYKRHLNGDFAQQRNFGLKKAKGEWVLFIDADERVSAALRAEIISYQLSITNYSGFYLKRKDFFLGRWLKHGETSEVKLLKLVKKGSGEWQGKVHEQFTVLSQRTARHSSQFTTKNLKTPLLHYPHPTIADFLKKINFYSTLRAEELYQKGIRIPPWQIIIFPLGKFIQNYILRQGFLDGMSGLIMAAGMSFHSFLVRSKLYMKYKIPACDGAGKNQNAKIKITT